MSQWTDGPDDERYFLEISAKIQQAMLRPSPMGHSFVLKDGQMVRGRIAGFKVQNTRGEEPRPRYLGELKVAESTTGNVLKINYLDLHEVFGPVS